MTEQDSASQLANFAVLRASMNQLLTGYERELARHAEARQQADGLTGVATSGDELVTVNVDHTGAITGLELGWETFGRYTPAQLAETIVATTRAAIDEVRADASKLTAVLPVTGSLHTEVADSKPIAVPTEIKPRVAN